VESRIREAGVAMAGSWSCCFFPGLESDVSFHLLGPLCPHILLPSTLKPRYSVSDFIRQPVT